jgi:hypothetical protein
MPWEWSGISRNPNITMEFIEKHLDSPWDWNTISSNPNLTMEFIEANPDKPWNWLVISNTRFDADYDRFRERYSSRLMLMASRKKYCASL